MAVVQNQTPVCLHTCTGGTVLLLGNVPQWEGRELLGAGTSVRSVPLYSWLLLSNCRVQEPSTGTAHSPDPWTRAGSCHTSPWHWDPLLQPCSISHCFWGGQKADLRQENSTSANKVLWPVPSFCSLSFCRFQNSRLLISLNNFHNLLKPKKKEPELKHTPLWE